MLGSEILKRVLPIAPGLSASVLGELLAQGARVPVVVESGLIPLTAVASGAIGGTFPQDLPGYIIVPHTARFLFTVASGVLTQAPQIQVGSNMTINNLIPTTTLAFATINTAITNGGPPFAFGLTVPTVLPLPDLGGSPALSWFCQTAALFAAGGTLSGHVQIGGLLRAYP